MIVRKSFNAARSDVGKKVDELLNLKPVQVTLTPVANASPAQYTLEYDQAVTEGELIKEEGTDG